VVVVIIEAVVLSYADPCGCINYNVEDAPDYSRCDAQHKDHSEGPVLDKSPVRKGQHSAVRFNY